MVAFSLFAGFAFYVKTAHRLSDHLLWNHVLNVFNSFLQLIDGYRLLLVYLNHDIGLGGIMREYRSKLYGGHSTLAFVSDDAGLKMCIGERNNFHRCVTHHAVLYFPLAIFINCSANLYM